MRPKITSKILEISASLPIQQIFDENADNFRSRLKFVRQMKPQNVSSEKPGEATQFAIDKELSQAIMSKISIYMENLIEMLNSKKSDLSSALQNIEDLHMKVISKF